MRKPRAAGSGVIRNARDPFAYLGHFRNAKYLKAGHNQIGPELIGTLLGTEHLYGGEWGAAPGGLNIGKLITEAE